MYAPNILICIFFGEKERRSNKLIYLKHSKTMSIVL